MPRQERFFHLHLVSDSTGETLIAASRAVSSQYRNTRPIEHVHRMVRSPRKLDEVIAEIDSKPGIVLYTIADLSLVRRLAQNCRDMGMPCVSLLEPVYQTFQSYLGVPTARKSGAQHELNTEYFNRIDALNFALMHDDGQLPDDLEEAHVILLGISRTSKTPTSIYLANRGVRVANLPLVPGLPVPPSLLLAEKPLVIALIASADRIHQVRQNRILGLSPQDQMTEYTNRAGIAEELAYTRKLCDRHGWPMIDVSRKSIEETAAAIIARLDEHRQKRQRNSMDQHQE